VEHCFAVVAVCYGCHFYDSVDAAAHTQHALPEIHYVAACSSWSSLVADVEGVWDTGLQVLASGNEEQQEQWMLVVHHQSACIGTQESEAEQCPEQD
jgi:hypothetical protein